MLVSLYNNYSPCSLVSIIIRHNCHFFCYFSATWPLSGTWPPFRPLGPRPCTMHVALTPCNYKKRPGNEAIIYRSYYNVLSGSCVVVVGRTHLPTSRCLYRPLLLQDSTTSSTHTLREEHVLVAHVRPVSQRSVTLRPRKKKFG